MKIQINSNIYTVKIERETQNVYMTGGKFRERFLGRVLRIEMTSGAKFRTKPDLGCFPRQKDAVEALLKDSLKSEGRTEMNKKLSKIEKRALHHSISLIRREVQGYHEYNQVHSDKRSEYDARIEKRLEDIETLQKLLRGELPTP